MKIPFTSGCNKILPSFSGRNTAAALITLSFVFILAGITFASEGGGHGGHHGWASTDTFRIMNFAVLIIALFFLLRKPVSKALNGRITGIQEQLEELEQKKVAAEAQLSEYNKKIQALDLEAEKIVEEYIRQGNEAKERILKEAESAAERLEEQAKRNIEHEFAQAKVKLQAEVIEKALAKAEELITAKITAEDQDKLVDEYLEKVVA
jgi:F-type H+-transporting ATPase subunit b